MEESNTTLNTISILRQLFLENPIKYSKKSLRKESRLETMMKSHNLKI